MALIDRDRFQFVQHGCEGLHLIEPLWREQKTYHAALPWPFAFQMAVAEFAQRTHALRDKAKGGRMVVELVLDRPNANRPVAYCVSSVSSDGVGEIDSLFVTADLRGQGLGKRLTENALEWMRHLQPKRTIVIVATANESAIEFYRQANFESRTIEMELVAPHDDSEESR